MAYAEPAGLREVPVDWAPLEKAFENNAPEVRSYLHLTTGNVLRVIAGVADPETHATIAQSSAYLRVGPVNSREQYTWMERFIPMVEDERLVDRLFDAIDGQGAFRRFKDVLTEWPAERERWLAFRSERLRVFMEAWLAGNGITPVARELTPPPARREVIEYEPPVTQAALTNSRPHRSRDELLKSLDAAAQALGSPRDLETVLAFAEFVRAKNATGTARQRPARASTSAYIRRRALEVTPSPSSLPSSSS